MNCLLITGASAGIGLATAQRFLEAGWRVVNLSRRPCPDPRVHHVAADLGDPAFLPGIEAALSDLLSGADRIALVHNAAR